MQLLNEHYQPITNQEDINIANNHFWEYRYSPKVECRGFYLIHKTTWNEICGGSYLIQIGREVIEIPVNFHILIADWDGGLDCLKVDEICGRHFEAFTVSNTLESESWILKDLRVIGFNEESRIAYPNTRKPVAVSAGEGRAIVVSPVDIYNKISSYSFRDIV